MTGSTVLSMRLPLVFACACVSSDTPLVSIGFDFLNSNEQPSTNLLDLKNLALGKFNTWQLSVLRIILHIEICVRASLAVTPRKYRLQRQRSYFTWDKNNIARDLRQPSPTTLTRVYNYMRNCCLLADSKSTMRDHSNHLKSRHNFYIWHAMRSCCGSKGHLPFLITMLNIVL